MRGCPWKKFLWNLFFIIGYFRVHLGLHFKASLGAKSLLWKSVFIHIEIRTNYHNKSFALRLALKERLGGTRKWPIMDTCAWTISSCPNRENELYHLQRGLFMNALQETFKTFTEFPFIDIGMGWQNLLNYVIYMVVYRKRLGRFLWLSKHIYINPSSFSSHTSPS